MRQRKRRAPSASCIEVFQGEAEMLICVELPQPSTVRAHLEAQRLGIHISRKDADWYGDVHVPANTDPAGTTATFADGVLAIRIPRLTPDDARRPPERLN